MTDGLVEARREVTLVSLLFARLRSFVGHGYGAVGVLLFVVGWADPVLAVVAGAATSGAAQ